MAETSVSLSFDRLVDFATATAAISKTPIKTATKHPPGLGTPFRINRRLAENNRHSNSLKPPTVKNHRDV
jgi:hypothetical protein